MRLAEFEQLSPEEQERECRKELAAIRESAREMDKLGTWDFPKDFRKRLKRGEELTIWRSNKNNELKA